LKLTTGLSSLLLSLGTAFIGYALEIFTAASFATKAENAANPVVKYVGPTCAVSGVLLFLAGAAAAIGYWVTWGRVKENTKTINITARSG